MGWKGLFMAVEKGDVNLGDRFLVNNSESKEFVQFAQSEPVIMTDGEPSPEGAAPAASPEGAAPAPSPGPVRPTRRRP